MRSSSLPFSALAATLLLACGSAPSSDLFAEGPAPAAPGDDAAGVADSGSPPSPDAPAPGKDTAPAPVDAPTVDVPAEDHAPTPPPGDSCADAVPLTPTATAQEYKGDSAGASNKFDVSPCAASAKGNDLVFAIDHPGGDLWLDTYGSTFDTIIDLRNACGPTTGERACSHRTSTGTATSRIVYRGLAKGRYFAILDSPAPGGGPFRLGYQAPGFPAQSACDTAPILLSDYDSGGKSIAVGVDLTERVEMASMASNVELRPGASGKDTCPSATGQPVFGQGPDQIYRLTLSAPRTIKITVRPEGSTFVDSGPAKFDVLVYLRAASGPPTSDAVGNCKDSTSDSDTCVPFDTEVPIPAGDWWLVVDSIGGSTGKFRAHVDLH